MDANQITADETIVRPTTPLTITTIPLKDFAINTDGEPLDGNSMGPGGDTPALNVAPPAPPAPSHCNDFSRRHSSSASFDASAMGIMADISLDSPAANTVKSPVDCFIATTTTSPARRDAALSAAMFSTDHPVSMPTNSTKSAQFVLESPLAIEMQHFSNDPTIPADTITSAAATAVVSDATSWGGATVTKERRESWQSSFFTGFLAIPPSLAGRPALSPEYAEYAKREFERGPVPLMWPKKEDIESQGTNLPAYRTQSTTTTATTAADEPSGSSDSNTNNNNSSWFNWNFWPLSQNTMPSGEQSVMAH
ncbi:hypothetical protein BGX27_008851 [Mortierella sp. AM989]|nr:hypothetical protein BGX27_008851 [Mortierella sp. AM989]